VAIVVALALVGCPSEPDRPPKPTVSVHYERATRAARSWLDGVEVDPIALDERDVRGKKKLAEILAAYLYLLRYSTDPDERPRLLRRVRELAAHTERPEYHDMLSCDRRAFNRSRMSYLRVAWLLERLGWDARLYRERLAEMRPRLERELVTRPPAQPARLAAYYDDFGWPRPALLDGPARSVLDEPPGPRGYRVPAAYALAHEVSTAFRFGLRRNQEAFDRADLERLRRVLPALVLRYARPGRLDLVAELVSAMTYLELHTLPAHRTGIALLLRHQNPDGSWGDFEAQRATHGDEVDQRFYLHTTLVALRALLEAHDGAWLRSDPAEPGARPSAAGAQRAVGPGST
jgi:hypothetical protein